MPDATRGAGADGGAGGAPRGGAEAVQAAPPPPAGSLACFTLTQIPTKSGELVWHAALHCQVQGTLADPKF